MTKPRHHINCLPIGTVIAIVLAGSSARGQDDENEVIAEAPRQLAPEELVRLQNRRVILGYKKNLETWVAGTYGDAAGLRNHLETCLAARLDGLRTTCHLTETQKNKLQLAGRGDIKRMLDRLDSVLKKWTDTSFSDCQIVLSDTRELVADIDNPFATHSLFSKIQVATLSREQILQNESRSRDKNSVQYQEAVTQTVHRLARLLDLNARQRDDLASLILTDSMAPLKFGQSEYAFVMFQASRLPETKLRAIFNERQWRTIKPQFVSWSDSEQSLRAGGFEFGERQNVKVPEIDKIRSR